VDDVKNFIINFLAVFYEAMPFIVLGSVISGVLEEMVPQQLISRFVPKNRKLAIGLSALLGIIFPMCECGIVPVMRRLLRKGLPLSCCVAYMHAGPIINVVVFLSTLAAFSPHKGGYWILGFRMGLGYLVAVGTAIIVDRLYRKYGDSLLTDAAKPKLSLPTVGDDSEKNEPEARKPWMERIGNMTETALSDFVDITVFLSLGAVLAALSKQFIGPADIEGLSLTYPIVAILVMMGLAIVMCLCSEADAFVAASFTTMHPSAKIAFLVLGPMLDFKLYMMFTRVYRPRLIWTIIIALIVQVLIYSLIVHYLWDPLGLPRAVSSA
jgi:uncharacterized protein